MSKGRTRAGSSRDGEQTDIAAGVDWYLKSGESFVLVDVDPFRTEDVVDATSSYAGENGCVIHDDVLGKGPRKKNVETIESHTGDLSGRATEIKNKVDVAVDEFDNVVYLLTNTKSHEMLVGEGHEAFLEDMMRHFRSYSGDDLKTVLVADQSTHDEDRFNDLKGYVDAYLGINNGNIVYITPEEDYEMTL